MDSFERFIRSRLDEEERQRMAGESAVVCSAAAGNPVLFVSETFERHTGYPPSMVIGRNLSFLQGAATEASSVARFRHLIGRAEAGTVQITNYRKDGSAFVHECELRPVRDAGGALTHFVAVQRPKG
jgi:PAS domain S-box-containing protein